MGRLVTLAEQSPGSSGQDTRNKGPGAHSCDVLVFVARVGNHEPYGALVPSAAPQVPRKRCMHGLPGLMGGRTSTNRL
jgi:hypothetical protein